MTDFLRISLEIFLNRFSGLYFTGATGSGSGSAGSEASGCWSAELIFLDITVTGGRGGDKERGLLGKAAAGEEAAASVSVSALPPPSEVVVSDAAAAGGGGGDDMDAAGDGDGDGGGSRFDATHCEKSISCNRSAEAAPS